MNALAHESSPYLLQHAGNPVNWYAWNAESIQKAAEEDKMLLISIGYAACHWCHVMAHECFEDAEVAEMMNAHFICIKVDREERPDIDQVYMDAAYLINGNGGWPLNALALPDGKPFFAGTYYPKESWMRLLQYFAGLYKKERSKLQEQAAYLSEGIRHLEAVPLNKTETSFDPGLFDGIFHAIEERTDWHYGGIQGGMKFALPSVWEWLLAYHHFTGNEKALEAVTVTLQYMARGGIYDHVGGGFARYATDAQWHVPHFEKMAYDNAQLISLYSHAFMKTSHPLYRSVVYDTIAFVLEDLTGPESGFYSSLDADSEGEEGKYYTWTSKEIEDILKEDAPFYMQHYGITESGNWEQGRNIPDSSHQKIYSAAGKERAAGLNRRLLQERRKRVPPATDDKILASWNALMATGFIHAYRAFGDEAFYLTAKKNIDFILQKMTGEDFALFRNYKGKASVPAFLDDYAFLIRALINLYQLKFEEAYLYQAYGFTETALRYFSNEANAMFFYTDERHNDQVVRKAEITDQVIPSSNSEMAINLLLLGKYFDRPDLEKRSLQMVKNISDRFGSQAVYHSNWAMAAMLHSHPVYEITITGSGYAKILDDFQEHYLPNALFMGGESSTLPLSRDKHAPGQTLIYVCRNKTCGLPVTSVEEALRQMN